MNCEPGPPVTCTDLQDVQPLQPGESIFMFVPVDTPTGAPAAVINQATVTGGAAASATATETTVISPSPALFGFHEFNAAITEADGTAASQAGAHPYQMTVNFNLNNIATASGSVPPAANAKDITANLPRGVVVNPQVTAKCTEHQLEQNPVACPDASAVGTVQVTVGLNTFPSGQTAALYNMVPSPGVPAEFGFDAAALGIFVHLRGQVRTGQDYGLSASAHEILQFGNVLGASVTLWGNPSDPSHDAQRGHCVLPGGTCAVERENKALLTMPSACSGPLTTTISGDSWQNPGTFIGAESQSRDSLGNLTGVGGCQALDFSPSLRVQPDTTAADSPSGLSVDLHLPQEGLTNPSGLAEANLKAATVTLPEGLVVDPSAANGLAACSSAQIDLKGAAAANCPEASKIGTVEVDTPLLDHPLPGAVYLAAQGDNPFHSLLALYIAVNDPQTGVVIKLAGKVEPNPVTGQLTATFNENPQLPFEDLKLNFFGGPRAALTTPPTCGAKATTTVLSPWSAPQGEDAHPTDSLQITSGAGGSPCATTEAGLANRPAFEAGTAIPIAGSYSPFVLKVNRENGSQRISSIDTTLPEGLLGRLAGIPYCSDAAIAAAAGTSGVAEQASPSCPPASEVGTVNVGAGSGTPYYVQGHAYLAGPYKGAPLSLAIITPAVAGPFDLGTVAVRTALYVNETTAQIHAVSDAIPSILQGIPLDVRSIALNLNRPNFTLNPTNCSAMAVLGSTTSTLGQVAPLSNRFQVGGCNGLEFAPKLKLQLKGSTQRGKNPALKAVLTQSPGQANISRVAVTLPKSEFIDNRHINNPCTRVEFNAGSGNGAECPAKSILGYAKAYTPILGQPLQGPVYFRSNGGERELPDLVASLSGQVHLNVVGFIDSVHHKGSEVSRTRNTFAMVPDAPVSRFVLNLKGGKKGLLQNSANLCKVSNVAHVSLRGQNGKVHDLNPKIANQCGKKKHHAKKGKGKKHK
ncbi:MAG: hypothetical protein H0X42_09635 [Solirubrobacterales bacterium]|nr:hypothetical protein [Solirubrobacterales bacterium]